MIFFKNKKLNGDWLPVSIVVFLALVVRYYNFSQRLVFGPEQAMSLLSAGENFTKPSLLGIDYILRATSSGLSLFTSPLFGYSLMPLMAIFRYNPIFITAYFPVLNVMTGLVVYWICRKIFKDKIVALFSLIVFLFNSWMIYHSMFIWISNYMPLVGAVNIYIVYLLYKNKTKTRTFTIFCLGLVSGIGFGLQYFYFVTIIVNVFFLLGLLRKNFTRLFYFALGFLLGEAPTVVFDIKHGFYHLHTLWQYFLETLRGVSDASSSYYHFLSLWPLGAIGLGFILFKIWKSKYQVWTAVFIVLYIFINLLSIRVSFFHPIGMPKDLTYKKVNLAARFIAEDNPHAFNVVSLLDFDARGHILRYPLIYLYGKVPMGPEEYSEPKTLYVLGPNGFDFSLSKTWEITSFKSFDLSLLANIDDNYVVYKLDKK